MIAYKKLDLSKLNFSEDPLKYDEIVQDTKPLVVGECVLQGKRGIKVTKAEKDHQGKCVKLDINTFEEHFNDDARYHKRKEKN